MNQTILNSNKMEFESWWSEEQEEAQYGEQEQTENLRDYCYSLVDNSQISKFGQIRVIKLFNKIADADINQLHKIKEELLDSQIDPIHERGSFSNKEYNKRYGRS